MTGRWGILGGTFDPPHYGHLSMAAQVCQALDLAGVLWIPAGRPPHKPSGTLATPEQRLELVRRAIAGDPQFRVSRLELDRAGPSYTVDTLEALHERPEPEDADPAEYVLIASAEAIEGLPGWRSPERLLELCRVAVFPRLGYLQPDLARLAQRFPGRSDRIVLVSGSPLGHSSSDIRRRCAGGLTIRYLVPPPVEQYITETALYRGPVAGQPTDRAGG